MFATMLVNFIELQLVEQNWQREKENHLDSQLNIYEGSEEKKKL